jgi:mannose-6-phosphate isomerase-like protein (cupin superfamily)
MANLKDRKKELLVEIKVQIGEIEKALGKMEREPFELEVINHDQRYKNDFTGNLESCVKKLKEIFEEAERIESDEGASLKNSFEYVVRKAMEKKRGQSKDTLKGFVTDIEKDTINNNYFRKVLYTGKKSQLVLMSLKRDEDIGEETHDVDQFFRVDAGSGKVIINNKEHAIKDGVAFIVPAGVQHNVINTGKEDLKLYSIYSPPHHQDQIIHKTKEEALKDDEHFDGKTTE